MSDTATAATIRMICASASSVLPITLPASSARAGIAVSRISITRVCFSSTTLVATGDPNVIADIMKTRPKAIARM